MRRSEIEYSTLANALGFAERTHREHALSNRVTFFRMRTLTIPLQLTFFFEKMEIKRESFEKIEACLKKRVFKK